MAASIMTCRLQLQPFMRLFSHHNGRSNVVNVFCVRNHSDNVKEDDCDFFGIPENYKLEHQRLSNIISKTADDEIRRTQQRNATSNFGKGKVLSDGLTLVEEYHTNNNSSRRERREKLRQQMKPYRTRFGVISIADTTNSSSMIPSTDGENVSQVSRARGKVLSSQSDPLRFLRGRREDNTSVDSSNVSMNSMSVKLKPLTKSQEHNFEGHPLGGGTNATSNKSAFSDINSQYFNLSHSKSLSDFRSHPAANERGEEFTIPPEGVHSNFDVMGGQLIDNFTMDKPFPKESNDNSLEKSKTSGDTFNLFDEFYFSEALSKDTSTTSTDTPRAVKGRKESEFNTVDDQYFGTASFDSMGMPLPRRSNTFGDMVSSYNHDDSVHHHETNLKPHDYDVSHQSNSTKPDENVLSSEKVGVVTNKTYLYKKKTIEQKSKLETTTAYDLAMKIREEKIEPDTGEQEKSPQALLSSISQSLLLDDDVTQPKGKVDSKGYRILSDQVIDLYKMPSMDVLEMLTKMVIFDHVDFLVIDKPYGLPSFGQKQDTFSLSSLLPAFGEMLPRKCKAHDLHLVHGLDRDVTGALILAKNPEVAYMLKGQVKANEIIQRFRTITKGVPSPRSGRIDIPIGEGQVGNIYKMVLRPHYSRQDRDLKKSSKAPSVRAVTEFSVLSSYLQAALVECTLHSNVKHQVRVHLANGLNTPILGDHKYSHFSKLAPQKLDRTSLELLKVRQAKVRHIPLHLHCHSLVVPYQNKTFVITSHLPKHFSKNMKSLKLYLPKK